VPSSWGHSAFRHFLKTVSKLEEPTHHTETLAIRICAFEQFFSLLFNGAMCVLKYREKGPLLGMDPEETKRIRREPLESFCPERNVHRM
jgi:hypothetical protein